MRGCEVSLVLLVLVLSEAPRGAAAPVQSIDLGDPMAKIYPRGNHWAVGHLMGKKSAGDFPFAYEGRDKIALSPVIPDSSKQLSEYLQWEEMEKNFLPLLEEKGSRSSRLLRHGLLGYPQPAGDLEDDDGTKDEERKCSSIWSPCIVKHQIPYKPKGPELSINSSLGEDTMLDAFSKETLDQRVSLYLLGSLQRLTTNRGRRGGHFCQSSGIRATENGSNLFPQESRH
uniref:Gastrin-releasing peptide n=1 Tax=Monodelphis domestica TaxID=13616 RepID=A0A5F8G8N5_MONDO